MRDRHRLEMKNIEMQEISVAQEEEATLKRSNLDRQLDLKRQKLELQKRHHHEEIEAIEQQRRRTKDYHSQY